MGITVNGKAVGGAAYGGKRLEGIASGGAVVLSAAVYTYTLKLQADITFFPASGGSTVINGIVSRYRNGALIDQSTVLPTISGTATGFTVTASTSTVAASGRGTSAGAERSITITGKFTDKNSVEHTATIVIKQQANEMVTTYETTISASPTTIPAAGGTSKISGSIQRIRTYTSGGSSRGGMSTQLTIVSGPGSIESDILTIPTNTTSVSRQTVVKISYQDISDSVTVTQLGV